MISYLKRLKNKFKYAWEGLCYALRKDDSVRLQIRLALLVIAISFLLKLSFLQWCSVLVMICLVIGAELLNSAVEKTVDAIYPEYHEQAKQIKDLCAAFVLMISLAAAIVGIYVIGGQLCKILLM